MTSIEANGSATLKLEGKLSGPWVDEMQQCWVGTHRQWTPDRVQLNLEDLTYVDNRGRDLLLQMQHEGASLVGASEFLLHLLHGERSRGRHLANKQNHNEEIQNGSTIRP